MRDRFDLEQEIMTCWNVVEDLKFYITNSDVWTADEQMNYINGITVKYDKRFEQMFELFEECVANGVFNPTGGYPVEDCNIPVNYTDLESAYDDKFEINLGDLNNRYYPGK